MPFGSRWKCDLVPDPDPIPSLLQLVLGPNVWPKCNLILDASAIWSWAHIWFGPKPRGAISLGAKVENFMPPCIGGGHDRFLQKWNLWCLRFQNQVHATWETLGKLKYSAIFSKNWLNFWISEKSSKFVLKYFIRCRIYNFYWEMTISSAKTHFLAGF